MGKEKDKDVLSVDMMEKFLVQKNKIYLKMLYKELIFTWVGNALLFKNILKKAFSN